MVRNAFALLGKKLGAKLCEGLDRKNQGENMIDVFRRLLRTRYWSRYIYVLVTSFVLSVVLLCLHQWRPIRANFDDFIQSNWVAEEKAGLLPIFFSKGDEKCGLNSVAMNVDSILPNLPVKRSRFDNRRLLRIYDYIRIGNEWEELVNKYDLCLATQSSLDRIYWLPQVLDKWSGPLSLAVHITSEEEWLVLNLFTRFLERCFPHFRDQVSMHLALPASLGPFCFDEDKLKKWNASSFEEIEIGNECGNPKEYMSYLLEMYPTTKVENLALKEVYPQNHLRNIARKACGTDWTYLTDVDIIPREGMAEMLQEFYDRLKTSHVSCDKCAFVIPTFELDETKPFPKNKEEIISHFESEAARKFHGKFWDIGHNATDYKKWTTTNLEDGPVRISHKIIKSKAFMYEPFYISSDTIPPFDERFLGYGFTRSSQIQEALYAGWRFTVLTPVFSIHWGLQSYEKLLFPKKDGVGENVRKQQTDANKRLFNKVIKEMKLKRKEKIF